MRIFFALSLFLNVGLFGYILFMDSLNWTVEPRFGVLKQDIHIGQFGEESPILLLPKGLSVKDVSPVNKIDLFEPNRFSITVTSEKELVDYSSKNNHKFPSIYSADSWNAD
ncbi:MAG: hypothetical protein ACXW4B_09165 [Micavibrio sp.]